MSAWNRWWGRLGAVLGTVALSAFVPVAAWASTGSGEVVTDVARRRGGFGFLGLLCCLLVVGVIVAIVLLMMQLMRNRRGGPPR
ncbi:hypothetical protein ABZ671_06060 [Micromonospora sp. NPDC006766]|uniref:hypothetical protein n=1 Tax=Micromonospora sp. NPDC006766 TaxID=3154778 RepID=UPI0033DAE158